MPSRPAAAGEVDDVGSATGDEGDNGEATYTAACEQLHINRVQRVIDGLSTASLQSAGAAPGESL